MILIRKTHFLIQNMTLLVCINVMNVIRGTKYFIIKKGEKMKNKYKKLLKSGVINKDAKLGDLKSLLRQIGGQHYQDFVIQPAEFINKNKLLFAEGNAIKYIVRASKKGGREDLLKAKHYIDMIIERDYE
jgi:hypothetical protein